MTVEEAERNFDSASLSHKIASTKKGRVEAFQDLLCARAIYLETLASSGEYDHTFWIRSEKKW